ncbi:MAG: sulfotransferase [Spiribacter salinus]|uniref:Sulfotransferase n=1 Tax=Spiribacter salinus TaxID=1335746 RepID=A0A540VQH2_9GAMM|nr:MAG: sulfotransferase [Spiribacter salinus]
MYTEENVDSAPFFIVGCGRSGTTLLRSMLDSHPLVGVPLESLFIIDYLSSRRPPSVLRKLLPGEYELQEWGISCRPEDLSDCASAAEMIDRIHRLYLREHGKSRWGQKTPRFVRFGELLRARFPGARFIHMIRDPRAVASSLVRSNVHRSTLLHAAQRWSTDVSAGLDLKRKHPQQVLCVRYEEMVADPESELKRICAFLNLEFVETMLRFHERTPGAYGTYYDKIHSGLSRPVSTSSTDAWRKHLDGRDVAIVESICRGRMEELGYRCESADADRPGKVDLLATRVRRLPRMLAQARHYMKHRSGYVSCTIRRKLVLRTLGPVPINH